PIQNAIVPVAVGSIEIPNSNAANNSPRAKRRRNSPSDRNFLNVRSVSIGVDQRGGRKWGCGHNSLKGFSACILGAGNDSILHLRLSGFNPARGLLARRIFAEVRVKLAHSSTPSSPLRRVESQNAVSVPLDRE